MSRPGRVTESMFNGQGVVVPLADVQHVEKHNTLGLIVVTKHTRWDNVAGGWANSLWVDEAECDAFMTAWCRFRHELEFDTLMDISPQAEPDPETVPDETSLFPGRNNAERQMFMSIAAGDPVCLTEENADVLNTLKKRGLIYKPLNSNAWALSYFGTTKMTRYKQALNKTDES